MHMSGWPGMMGHLLTKTRLALQHHDCPELCMRCDVPTAWSNILGVVAPSADDGEGRMQMHSAQMDTIVKGQNADA